MIEDIANNKLEFPTLPEVALRVRKLIENPNVTTIQVAKALSTDASLTARLLQIANSAMFAGLPQLDTVKAAVNRIGLALVRNMITCVVMKALYQPRMSPVITKRMQVLWRHSAKVAAFSHGLAKPFSHLRSDEAMLAGLVHDIGSLPILNRVEKFPEIANDPERLQSVIDQLHGNIGKLILEAWRFPDELVTVAAGHEDIHRASSGEVDYVDIITVANLHTYLGSDHRLAKLDWSALPVFEKLNLSPEDSINVLREAKTEIAAVYGILSKA